MTKDRFDFKQFSIDQTNAAFKVGTDGCLLGAWTDVSACTRILDIGTGSGVISLMLAQRSHAHIKSIDIDRLSAQQAANNAKASPWSSQIEVAHRSLAQQAELAETFDLIVCNPPFFKHSSLSGDVRKDAARHEEQLGLDQLLRVSKRVASPSARLCLVIPVDRWPELETLAIRNEWHLAKRVTIQPVRAKNPNRLLLEFRLHVPEIIDEESWLLYDPHPTYSGVVCRMLEPYYMHL
ncbi:MAG: methyltransferase [Cryomorphaceae bacterium]